MARRRLSNMLFISLALELLTKRKMMILLVGTIKKRKAAALEEAALDLAAPGLEEAEAEAAHRGQVQGLPIQGAMEPMDQMERILL